MLSRYNEHGTVYWTRQRVIVGLQRFYRDTGLAPLSTADWQTRTSSLQGRQKQDRPYPASSVVLRHFRTFRDAWTAASIIVNRMHEEWTEIEDWYLHEAAGLVSRDEMARDLNRTSDAVHRRLYDLGLNSRTIHGWTPHRVQTHTGVPWDRFHRYMRKGLLPYLRGTRCIYLQPADLVVMKEIDWTACPELERTARRQLLSRFCGFIKCYVERSQGA